MKEIREPGPTPPDEAEPVPVFGSWRRIYLAVILCNLVVMALVAVFSAWPF